MVDLSSANIQRIASLQLGLGKDVKSLGVFVVHMGKCVCLHKSVGLDVDVRVHVRVQIHVGGGHKHHRFAK